MTSETARSPARRIRGVLAGIVLAIVCALALFTVVIPFVLGAQSYTVLTGSMRPALEPGHLIAVRAAPIDAIRVGDVVTYQLHSGEPDVVTHRVVAVGIDGTGERILTTQGDANNVADAAPVREVQVRGVLVYAVPWLGWINIWATPGIKSVVVAIVGTLAIGWGLVVLLRDQLRRRRLVTVGAAAVVMAGMLVGTIVPLDQEHAVAAESPRLLLSDDGVTWTDSGTLRLLDDSGALVPGDAFDISLWVRNDSPDPAGVRIDLAWVPTDPRDAADVSFAGSLADAGTQHTERDLGADASTQIPLQVVFPAAAGNGSRDASAALQVTVTLSQQTETTAPPETSPPDSSPLPPTGAEPPILALAGALVLIATGVILLIVRRMRRDRRD